MATLLLEWIVGVLEVVKDVWILSAWNDHFNSKQMLRAWVRKSTVMYSGDVGIPLEG